METTLAVQTCNLCESTNVHYHSELNKFVCNTCGQHMTEQETAVKHLIDNKLLRIAVMAILLLMCLPGISQLIVYKDTLLTVPMLHFNAPVINQSVVSLQADTLQLDSNFIKYVKVKGGKANSLAKLLNPTAINPVINLLQQTIDSIKKKFNRPGLYYYNTKAIPVGNGTAYKLPNTGSCLVDTALLTAYDKMDSSLYYLDTESEILKAKPGQITTATTGSIIFTATDVKKK